MNDRIKLLILDCDGTCYPWMSEFNGQFGKALFAVAKEAGYSKSNALKIGTVIRSEHPGMMNFLLALARKKQKTFIELAHKWCEKLDYNLIKPDPKLASFFSAIPVRTCIFTNNCQKHTQLVFQHLFSEQPSNIKIYTIEDTYDKGWFYPKQSPEGFSRLCAKENVLPQECCLIDDTPAILKIAQHNGMQTRTITAQQNLKDHLKELIRE